MLHTSKLIVDAFGISKNTLQVRGLHFPPSDKGLFYQVSSNIIILPNSVHQPIVKDAMTVKLSSMKKVFSEVPQGLYVSNIAA